MTWKNTRGMPQVQRKTITIDATGKVVGRLATEIAMILMGKHKPDYEAHIDTGDIVKITNPEKIEFTGKKWETKVHFRSSNRPSGVKATSMTKLREERPGEIIRHAVKYMLPKNKQQSPRMKRLIIEES
jgi:large subunit ribosomal protein L13